MSAWSKWSVDAARNERDSRRFHAWRARWTGQKWEYERRNAPRAPFESAEDMVETIEGEAEREAELAQLVEQMALEASQASAAKGSGKSSGKSKAKGKGKARASTPPAGGGRSSQSSKSRTQQWAQERGRAGASTVLPSQHFRHGNGVLTTSGLALKGYKKVPSAKTKDFFKFGRVFKTPITESTRGFGSESDVVFSEIVRMVVIRPHARHSLCLAIHTYNGWATIGRRAKDHLIIYTGDRAPNKLEDEDDAVLSRPPVLVRTEPPCQDSTLAHTSRLNLAELHTVSHQSLVKLYGTVGRRTGIKLRGYAMQIQLGLPHGGQVNDLADDAREDDAET